MSRYQVIVGNIGTTCDTDRLSTALKDYGHYLACSKSGIGRAGNEDVVLFDNGEPSKWAHYVEHCEECGVVFDNSVTYSKCTMKDSRNVCVACYEELGGYSE
jgi:hypothetical protein